MKTSKPNKAERAFLIGFRALAKEIYATGKASGFYDYKHTDPGFNHAEKIALMHSELSEALEGLRNAPFPGIPDDKLPHRPMVEAELADTVIRIMNYASHTGLDLSGAIVEKARFNRSRGHRHGGKRF
jgi:NTP pyrophosphatase (non-canonical NTP hydrolase)